MMDKTKKTHPPNVCIHIRIYSFNQQTNYQDIQLFNNTFHIQYTQPSVGMLNKHQNTQLNYEQNAR